MRRVALVGGAALVVSALAPLSRANLLLAPSFEISQGAPDATTANQFMTNSPPGVAPGGNPWYSLNTATLNQSAYSSSIPPFSGTGNGSNRLDAGGGSGTSFDGFQYAYAFSVGAGTGGHGGAAQIVQFINPGDIYTGSAFFYDKNVGGGTTDGDRLQSTSNDSIAMIFEDSTGAAIGSPVLSTSTVSAASTPNTWIQLTTPDAVAPAGATQMVFELLLTRGTAGGVMFADAADLETTHVPEPTSICALSAGAFLLTLRRRRN
jgi:hypothetical protein